MSKNINIGIYGAGGCGRSLFPSIQRSLIKENSNENMKFFFIDDYENVSHINDTQVLNQKDFINLNYDKKIFICISNSKIRKKLSQKLKLEREVIFPKHFDYLADIYNKNAIGEGCLISQFVTITDNVKIGKFFHANLYSYIEHDCLIGDFVTFAPGVKCNGNVTIKDNSYIGSGAIIKNGLKEKPLVIGKNVIIGAGAVVTKNIPDNSIAYGVPARVIGKNI
tara:strand:- start:7880 stop:8548 length:669 start_codon:yes stop_codon:yes gene_type:complete